jgi:2-polyprenyl-6-methoxyphenol hydroxylase-like FAD-dependent oxidoreductase
MRRALIIGGGVAGPVTAMALAKAGFEPIVYEAHATPPADLGTYLTVAVNGLSALAALDAHGVVCEAGFPTKTIVFFLGNGKRLADVTVGGELPDGTVTHTLKRSALHAALAAEAVRRGIAFERGKKLVDVQESADGVTARFADGSTAMGDFLVGCDGVHSTVRRLIDPTAPPARYTGLLNVGGFTAAGSVPLEPGTYHMIFGKRAFFGYTVSPAGEVWWFANPGESRELSTKDLQAITGDEWRRRLTRLYAADAGPAAEIIRSTTGPIVASSSYEIATLPVWHTERMVVAGDAAHAASPAAGQGASMAMEDAVILAQCLRDRPTPGAAFAEFERLRRDRVERVTAQGARSSAFKAVGPLKRRLRDRKLPSILRGHAEGGEHSLAWIHGHRVEWPEPAR